MCLSDEEIIKSLKQNKAKGIRLLFDRYYSPLVVYAEQILQNRHQAEDIVQDFFVRLWENEYLEKNKAIQLSAYLFTAVKNSCYTCRASHDTLRNTAELTGVEIPVEVFGEVDDIRIAKVMQEIERLPERTRMVVEEVILKQQKYQQVADKLDISINTVKFLLKEGVKRLRSNLTGEIKHIFLIFFTKMQIKIGK